MPPNPQHEHWPLVWIRPQDRTPDTCLSCGMFTDERVRTTLQQRDVRMVDPGSTAGDFAFGCLLSLLGPLGWIIAALMLHDQNRQKVPRATTTRQAMRVPQCRLCRATETLEPLPHPTSGAFGFHAHPHFEQRFREANPVN